MNSLGTIQVRSRKAEFLGGIEDVSYQRESTTGLRPYTKGDVRHGSLYEPSEASELIEAGVEGRMKVKISSYYNRLALGTGSIPSSIPLRNLVTARMEEVDDLDGELDPGNQCSHSPRQGILHKYEMLLPLRGSDLQCPLPFLLQIRSVLGKDRKGTRRI